MGSFPETYNDPFILFFADFCRQCIKTLWVCIAPYYVGYRGSEVCSKEREDDNGKGYFWEVSRRLSPPPLKKRLQF